MAFADDLHVAWTLAVTKLSIADAMRRQAALPMLQHGHGCLSLLSLIAGGASQKAFMTSALREYGVDETYDCHSNNKSA